MNTNNEKSKKFIKKLQNMSETQKLILAILGTVLLIAVIYLVVGFLNNLIISK
jgi:uncharacterized membrane protein